MNWLNYFLTLAIAGFIVGGLARLVTPGRESIGVFGTILAGLAGSFIGGLIIRFLVGSTNWFLTLAIAVACAILFILPFRIFVVQPVVVDRTTPRRGFFSRAVDDDYGYHRRPFWNRRRSLL